MSKQQLGPHGMGTVSGGFRLIVNQTKQNINIGQLLEYRILDPHLNQAF
jgi:hypothetical protein